MLQPAVENHMFCLLNGHFLDNSRKLWQKYLLKQKTLRNFQLLEKVAMVATMASTLFADFKNWHTTKIFTAFLPENGTNHSLHETDIFKFSFMERWKQWTSSSAFELCRYVHEIVCVPGLHLIKHRLKLTSSLLTCHCSSFCRLWRVCTVYMWSTVTLLSLASIERPNVYHIKVILWRIYRCHRQWTFKFSWIWLLFRGERRVVFWKAYCVGPMCTNHASNGKIKH